MSATTKDLLQAAERIVAEARRLGAQQVRASVRRERKSSVEWRDGKLDRVRESTEMGASVHLFVDGRYSAHSTSDLRQSALSSFLAGAVANTRVIRRDEHRKLPEPARYAGIAERAVEICDAAGVAKQDATERRRLAAALEEAARTGQDQSKIVAVNTSCSDTLAERATVTSNGMQGAFAGTYFSLFAMTSVRDAGHRKPTGYWYAVRRRRADLPTVASVGEQATRRALACLGEKPDRSGRFACIIENAVVARLLDGLLGALYGEPIQQRRSFLADKLDQRIAASLLTITDDPLLGGGLGTGPFDGEGMASQRRPVIERGVLRTFFLDTYYASKLGKQPTTGDWSNLVFAPGKRDLAGLCRAMDDGILVTGFSGGNVNSATGDFSIGIRGQRVVKGQPVRPVAEMNLAGNHLELWKQLRELGADPFHSSTVVAPSLRFAPLQFSGT